MPIKIPNQLPAYKTLTEENIFIMDEFRAETQDIRPLQIAIVNLMPTKIDTETQLMRLISNTSLQVETVLIRTKTHIPKHVSREHLDTFYTTFDEIKHRNFDGMIITGAPVEQLPFEQVEYWDELCEIMAWSAHHVHSTIHICWGAQAGLYYHFGIPKYPLKEKLFGVYPHKVDRKNAILFRGFDDVFMVPHSRYTEIRLEDVLKHPQIKVLASSEEAGLYALMTENGRQIFLTGHSEYDANTLENEYLRDKNAGLGTKVPKNYYPDDDDTKKPRVSWRSCANLLFSNWLNYFVYQTTPYDLNEIK